MAYQASVLGVMIASPGDVDIERHRIRSILHEINDLHAAESRIILLPVGWETHSAPDLAGRAQEIINEQVLNKCDILVGVFWTRLGTPTGESESGTVEEIKRHVESGKPAMIYFSQTPVKPDKFEHRQWDALQNFKAWCMEKGLIVTYADIEDFAEKFRRQILILLRENKYINEIIPVSNQAFDGRSTQSVTLSEEAGRLLLEASNGDGFIMNLPYLGGQSIKANNKEFITSKERRHVARWEAALQELENLGLIQDRGYKREVFELTARGYEAADSAVEVDPK